jgi:hypothetical protein
MTGPNPPYRSRVPAARDGFAQLLHAEWTKFWTVPGWVIGLSAAVAATALLSLVSALGDRPSCRGGCPSIPVGPGGEAVADTFYFVHQPLGSTGSITVRVTSLTGLVPAAEDVVGRPPDRGDRTGRSRTHAPASSHGPRPASS